MTESELKERKEKLNENILDRRRVILRREEL